MGVLVGVGILNPPFYLLFEEAEGGLTKVGLGGGGGEGRVEGKVCDCGDCRLVW